MTRKLSIPRLHGTLFESLSVGVLDSPFHSSDKIDFALDQTETPP
jgi:hypothetical protein